jgi:propionyl-CoA carboxylase alpha chain
VTVRIRRILVANRGEVVERVIRTARRMGIETIAVYSDADRDARFVDLADAAVPIGGRTPTESYLNQDSILAAAAAAGADAVHPGYGFLAESAEFARRCSSAGLVFIGPSPETIELMGDKVSAKARARAVGVPLLDTVPVEEGAEPDVSRLRWPLIVKAAAGGGGKGMHIVERPEELAIVLERAQREAASAFGDGRVFVEPYLSGARHIEVQIFGDLDGSIAVLHERECSIQRRYQKIVEEAPSTAVDDVLRARLGDAARDIAASVDYLGAGTVEFLLSGDDFYFLEMNTRLQVEHAVTEEITGLDLVELQIRVACGEPLPPDALTPRLNGCAIEVRLYAEDPTENFAPATGRLAQFELADYGVRVESGVASGDIVTPFYDPMLAKIVSHADDRSVAAGRLAARLAESRIEGIATNRDLLVRLLRDEEYLANLVDTQFLERPAAAGLFDPLASPEIEAEHALAAALAAQARRRLTSTQLWSLPSGWRNNRTAPALTVLRGRHDTWRVSYAFERSGLEATAVGERLTVTVSDAPSVGDEHVVLVVGGVRHRYTVSLIGERAWIGGHGASSVLDVQPRFPSVEIDQRGTLAAPMPGLVLSVNVQVDDNVAAGDIVAILEAMKMEIEIVAPVAGRVAAVNVESGSQVDAGKIVAVIEEEAHE